MEAGWIRFPTVEANNWCSATQRKHFIDLPSIVIYVFRILKYKLNYKFVSWNPIKMNKVAYFLIDCKNGTFLNPIQEVCFCLLENSSLLGELGQLGRDVRIVFLIVLLVFIFEPPQLHQSFLFQIKWTRNIIHGVQKKECCWTELRFVAIVTTGGRVNFVPAV